MTEQSNTSRNGLIIPAFEPMYRIGAEGAETLMRVLAGGLLAAHGYEKILNPFGAAGMVESLGFYPGAFWSPLLAATEFFGGILIAIGLFTRPASVAATFVLLVTVYFHWVVKAEGLGGAEKSILWAAILLLFAFRGGNAHSLDAKIGKQF